MAWDDPSPRTRAATSTPTKTTAPSAQPGYGVEPISAGRLGWCLVLAGAVGLTTALGAHSRLVRWHGHAGHASVLDLLLAVAVGLAVAMLAWRYLSRRRGGGGWMRLFGRRRFWADRYPGTTYTDIAVAEVVGDVVGGVIDAIVD